MIPEMRSRPSVVVVGAGFAGCHAARVLERLLPPDTAELTVISPTDHLYALPAAGNRLRVATSWAVKGDQR